MNFAEIFKSLSSAEQQMWQSWLKTLIKPSINLGLMLFFAIDKKDNFIRFRKGLDGYRALLETIAKNTPKELMAETPILYYKDALHQDADHYAFDGYNPISYVLSKKHEDIADIIIENSTPEALTIEILYHGANGPLTTGYPLVGAVCQKDYSMQTILALIKRTEHKEILDKAKLFLTLKKSSSLSPLCVVSKEDAKVLLGAIDSQLTALGFPPQKSKPGLSSFLPSFGKPKLSSEAAKPVQAAALALPCKPPVIPPHVLNPADIPAEARLQA